jgi:hypothetical protein
VAVISNVFMSQYNEISEAIAELQALNANASTRSRELSLAITELQTGLLWLTTAPGNVNDTEG